MEQLIRSQACDEDVCAALEKAMPLPGAAVALLAAAATRGTNRVAAWLGRRAVWETPEEAAGRRTPEEAQGVEVAAAAFPELRIGPRGHVGTRLQ